MNEIIEAVEAAPRALAIQPTTPAGLLELAVQRGASIEQMQALMVMKREWEADEARKAFSEDFARFKACEVVTIAKDKHVSYQGSKGVTAYDHATIGNVVATITAAISKYGFSHAWKAAQDKQFVSVTCTLRHKLGHFEEVTMSAEADGSGGKNAIQAIGSAVSYLQRYTLLAITGCATSDQPDDDGAGTAPPKMVEGVLAGLLADVAKAGDDAAIVGLWNTGKKTLASLGDQSAYDEFKAAAFARRTALKDGT